MKQLLFNALEYQGKSLLMKNIKPGMKGNEILEIISCALEAIYKDLDLSCVDFSKLGIVLGACNNENVKLSLCSLFTTLAEQLSITNTNVSNLSQTVSGIQQTVNSFTDKFVKVNGLDTTAGYLSDKIYSDQPDTVSVLPDNSKIKLHGFCPIGGIIGYNTADLSMFDATGKGKPNTDVWGFAMCNGKNGTNEIVDFFFLSALAASAPCASPEASPATNMTRFMNTFLGESSV